MNKLATVIAMIFILGLFAIIHAQTIWTESTFEDFRDGSFLDAGSNIYVSSRGRIQMINRWDLNGDGFLDIVLPGSQAHTEKENTYIYLNSGKDIDGRSRIDLPGCGSRDGILFDFDKDGYLDLAVANFRDSHYQNVNAWIYYGSGDGFSPQNRIELPGYQATSLAAGDFNNDGWTDLVIACQWQAIDAKENDPKMSFIFWNSSTGFKAEARLPLIFDGKGAHSVLAQKLDSDAIDDLIVLAGNKTYLLLSQDNKFESTDNQKVLEIKGQAVAGGHINDDEYPDITICGDKSVYVLLGDQDGYQDSPPLILEVDDPRDIALADVDQNGFDDVIVANHAAEKGATWVDSYIFFSDGKTVHQKNSSILPTLGASGVTAGDLNGDGYPEIVFTNQRVINEQSLLSYVYWNDNSKFHFGHHTQLATAGAFSSAIGDVNNDGYPDIIFFNDEGGFRDGATSSYVYWGNGSRDFSIERRTVLPTHQIFGCGHADLDDDGSVDLILARANFIAGIDHSQGGLSIYWGIGKESSQVSYLTMTTGYGGVRIADINRDGYLDLLAGGHCIDLENPERHGFPIFWGSAKGFQHQNRSIIHFDGYRIRGQLLMDLNRDGWLDIAGQVEDGKVKIWWGSEKGFDDDHHGEINLVRNDHLMYIKGADFNKDGWLDLLLPHRGPPEGTETTSFIYFGSENGYSNQNRTEISCYVTYQNSIADFDKDGWLDIFLCSYGGEVSGNRPSLIHWGSDKGFQERPRTELPTYGSSGSETVDYDGDGWLDILVANHRQAGSYFKSEPHRHITPSLLFWGGPAGFFPNRRSELDAIGPSGLSLRDLGNSYDRGLYEDYLSSIYQIEGSKKPVRISWEAETPFGTSVKFQIRLASKVKDLTNKDWQGPTGKNSWFIQSGDKIPNLRGKWIQYRARLESPNGGATPYLETVQIAFE
jgi:hypothetical protein